MTEDDRYAAHLQRLRDAGVTPEWLAETSKAFDESQRRLQRNDAPPEQRERDRDGAIADLIYAGNQLARAMQDSMQRRDDLTIAWYQAVENAIPEPAKPIVCRRSSREDGGKNGNDHD